MRGSLIAGLIAVFFAPCIPAGPNAVQEAPDQAKKNEDFYKAQSDLGRRTNGVRLQMTASVQTDGELGKGDQIRLDWTLDYEGPRPPLAILEPSLAKDTGGQTVARCYAEGKNRRPHAYEIASPQNVGRGQFSPKSFFLTVEKGRSTSGTILISVAKVREFYRKVWPQQFEAKAPVLRVQLLHKPFDRGVGFDLDAWTGEVYTSLVTVPLKKW